MPDEHSDDFLEPWDLHVLLQHVIDADRENPELYRRTQFVLSRLSREFRQRPSRAAHGH